MKKLCLALLTGLTAVVLTATLDLTGDCEVEANFDDSSFSRGGFDCAFKQDGEQLTGTCSGGSAQLTGELRGQNVSWKMKAVTYTGTVNENRELDTLKSVLSKAVEWKYLVDSPARDVRRFRLQNRRTRILSADEQRRLLIACERMPKLQALLTLALINRRAHRRAPGAALGGLPRRLFDLLADEERQGAANPHHGHDRGSPGRETADSLLGLHECEDRKALHHDPKGLRARSSARRS